MFDSAGEIEKIEQVFAELSKYLGGFENQRNLKLILSTNVFIV